ncbi:MAG: sigma-70 family RNA polymerase sigma factor [Bryobacterales bacterium]|nr:sigma-70 family RNA polymerase sigma factor [Bryobacterales bacterium]
MDQDVTVLLEKWRGGDGEALNALMPLVYDQLRSMAQRYMASENSGHTLRTTALVHEAYLKLVGGEGNFQNRAHFFAVAARAMRSILIDHARGGGRQKRGGEYQRVDFEHALLVTPDTGSRILEIDDSLKRLEAMDERKAKLIELIYFGGLTYVETAHVLGVSEATVHRDLKMARAWLYRDLGAA